MGDAEFRGSGESHLLRSRSEQPARVRGSGEARFRRADRIGEEQIAALALQFEAHQRRIGVAAGRETEDHLPRRTPHHQLGEEIGHRLPALAQARLQVLLGQLGGGR